MGGWAGIEVGIKVKPEDRNLATQFLNLLIYPDQNQPDFPYEVGRLNIDYDPKVSVVIDFSNDALGIWNSFEKHNEDYVGQFEFYGGKKKAVKTIPALDGLFDIINKLFPPATLFSAHECGDDTTDSYYRYEVIYDPSSSIMFESHCFYSYGDGINVDSDDPREEGTVIKERKIVKKSAGPKMINYLIDAATKQGFQELVEMLSKCK